MSASDDLPDKFGQFLDHWKSLRVGTGIPTLPDFLDCPLPTLQPWVAITDHDSDDRWHVRLVGTGIVAFFGVEFTGSNFLATLSDKMAPVFRRCHHEVVNTPCGTFHHSVTSTSTGREMDVRTVALPLLRTSGAACVTWLFDVGDALNYGEQGAQIRRMITMRWIDLGCGIPS